MELKFAPMEQAHAPTSMFPTESCAPGGGVGSLRTLCSPRPLPYIYTIDQSKDGGASLAALPHVVFGVLESV
jgi:hypothetical protein